jgi:hypothetical protein
LKEYTVAVVEVDVVYGADLRVVFSVLQEAGERLRAENSDVLAGTQVDGITAFGKSTMTVRTSTRVKPGRHEETAAALRLSITEAFDRRAPGTARKGLLPAKLTSTKAPDPRDRRERGGDSVDRALFGSRPPRETQS